jgi:hypothetical protein
MKVNGTRTIDVNLDRGFISGSNAVGVVGGA